MRILCTGGTAVLLLVSVAQAQSAAVAPLPAQPSSEARRIATQGPIVYAHYDLDSGESRVLGTGSTGARALSATPCFDNTVDDDLYDVLLYPAGDELFDWGVKSCGGSDFVERIVIGFASLAEPGPSAPFFGNGPGGSLTLRIYENALGHGVFGRQVAELTLSGLPSQGPCPSPPCGVAFPTMLTIDLGSQAFFLPDGPIGWSYENPDGLTGPILVDVVPQTGTELAYDVYRPGPATSGGYAGTFTLPPGGLSNDPLENSFYLAILENDSVATSTTIPAGSNPNSLVALDRPVVGSPWRLLLDLRSHPGVTLTAVVLSDRLVSTPTRFGELIVDLSSALLPASIAPNAQHLYVIPLDTALVGFQFYSQGAMLSPGAGVQLTNGLDGKIGTF